MLAEPGSGGEAEELQHRFAIPAGRFVDDKSTDAPLGLSLEYDLVFM